MTNTKNNYGTAYDYGTKGVQLALLKLLKIFHKECIDNNVIYSLSFGTLLGAIRHDGFIPWDDDADVMLSRKEFEKFIDIKQRNNEYEIERILWIYRIKEKASSSPATLDLFVVDNVPDNIILRSFKLCALKVLQGMMKGRVDYAKYPFIYRICLHATYLLGLLFSDTLKYKIYNMISGIGNDKLTKYVGIYNGLFKEIARLYSRDLMDKVMLHQFEDTELYIVSDFDKFLTDVYGDYMKPPSLKNRKNGTYDMYCNNEHVVVSNSKHM